MTLPCDDSAFFSKPSRAALALSVIGVTWSSASRITRSAWSAISRCLDHHEGTRLKCREHGLPVARRYTPLCLAPVVEGGDLRSSQPPARKGLVEKTDCRAVFVRRQYLEAAQSVAAPRPVADGLETARRLVIGVAAAARQSGLQRCRRLIVDVPPALNACPDRIRQHLREALHLGRGVGGVNEAGPLYDSLKSCHGFPLRAASLETLSRQLRRSLSGVDALHSKMTARGRWAVLRRMRRHPRPNGNLRT